MRAGETCVSTTAPFKYHNDGLEPLPPWGLIFHEPWTIIFPPPLELDLIFLETWTYIYFDYEQKFLEPWTS
ncbi:hypothetical protein ES703_50007 [subsurface metagenome]